MSNSWSLVITMAAVTALLRFLPFIILKFTKETPKLIIHLGNVLPQAAIGMLVVYCLKDMGTASMAIRISTGIAAILAAVLQARFKNIVYTVIGATAAYMVMLHIG